MGVRTLGHRIRIVNAARQLTQDGGQGEGQGKEAQCAGQGQASAQGDGVGVTAGLGDGQEQESDVVCLVQGVQCVLYKVCSVYCTLLLAISSVNKVDSLIKPSII